MYKLENYIHPYCHISNILLIWRRWQGAWVQFLVRELDPTCHTYELACRNYIPYAMTEKKNPMCHNEDQ